MSRTSAALSSGAPAEAGALSSIPAKIAAVIWTGGNFAQCFSNALSRGSVTNSSRYSHDHPVAVMTSA